MSLNRTTVWLVASVILACGASQARAQHYEAVAPFDNSDYHNAEPFAPAELSTYGGAPAPNEGFFASYERLYWTMSAPRKALVGANNVNTDFNTVIRDPVTGGFTVDEPSIDTGWLSAHGAFGNRFEAGFTQDGCGWLASGFEGLNQGQVNNLSPGNVVFADPTNILQAYDIAIPVAGTPAYFRPVFTTFQETNTTNVRGLEVMYTQRLGAAYGGTFDLYTGVRYMRIEDDFGLTGSGGVLDSFQLSQTATNNLIGPQIGGRWTEQCGRFLWNVEGRFMAAANFRKILQEGNIATNVNSLNAALPIVFLAPNLLPYGYKSSVEDTEFSPLGELRVQFDYQVTQALAVKLGYTALFTGGIARASNTIDYSVPHPNIIAAGWGDRFFMQGISVGVEYNR